MSKNVHFINGQWQTANPEANRLVSENPANGQLLWQGTVADAEQVNTAVKAARSAFKSWSATSLNTRLDYLRAYQEVLKSKQTELADTISRETGKHLWEAKTEIATMIGKVDLSIAAFHERSGNSEKNITAGVQASLSHRPHGVLAVLGPYNFPGHLPNGHIVPALLAGNTIVFKPSEITPLVAQQMIECWQQTELPAGVVNLLQGDAQTGSLLSAHDGIDGLLFTGSSKTGIALHQQFAGQPQKILALEMGGNNPLIVHGTNNIPAAVYNTIQSAFITAGQRCTCARRLIVPLGENGNYFVDALIHASEKLKVAMPNDDDSAFIGPVVSNQVADRMMSVYANLLDRGAIPLLQMHRPVPDRPLLTPGIVDVTQVDEREDEEYFGPLLQLIRPPDFDTAIIEANNTRYGLAAGLLTDDDDLWQRFYQQARAGIVNRNRPTTGASGAAPFGGVGASGNHRPSAYYAADYCAYPIASLCEEKLSLPDSLTPGIKL